MFSTGRSIVRWYPRVSRRYFRANTVYGSSSVHYTSQTGMRLPVRSLEPTGAWLRGGETGRHVVFFSGRCCGPAIIAIHRGTIPRNAFQSPVRRREKHFRRPEITRLNWFSQRCGNTRPDRAVVVRIKTSISLSPPPSTGGRDHQSGSVYSNAWNRTSREYEDNIRAFSGKPWQRNGRVHRLWRELDKPVCGGGLDSSEHGGQRQPFPQATRASITITIVCCLQHLKFTTAWIHKQFQRLFEGFNYLEESCR